MSPSTLFVVFVSAVLLALGYWYFLKQSGPPEPAAPAPSAPIEYVAENSNIERKIEQMQAQKDPPEIAKLRALLETFESDPTRWDALIAAGDLYRRGAYPRFLPNEELALRIYKIASMCPDGTISGIGQSKYVESRDDPIKDVDKAGEALPKEYGERLCEAAESSIQSTPWSLFEKPILMKKREPIVNVVEPGTENDFAAAFEVLRHATAVDAIETPAYRLDSQNVHDHGVTKATHFNLEKLKDNIDINALSSEEEVRAAILEAKDMNERSKMDALHVLDNLGEFKHGTFDATEREALALVWSKIQSEPDAIVRENLKETLAKQLASSVENGHVVCSSGKITRIVGALDGVSNDADSKPMWAVREEIATLAARTRDAMTERYGDTPEAGRRMREAFAAEARSTYVDRLEMEPKLIEPLIEEYSTGF